MKERKGKKMKTIRKSIAVFLALILLTSACSFAGAEQEVRRLETPTDADEWMTVFLGEHPEDLEGVWAMSALMEAAAAQVGGIGGLAQ